MGMVSPLGTGLDKSWERLLTGQSGVGTITRFDTQNLRTQIAGEVEDFDPNSFVPPVFQEADLFIQYALAAGGMAMAQAGLAIEDPAALPVAAERFGTIVGVACGGVGMIESSIAHIEQRGAIGLSPYLIPSVIPNLAAGTLSMHFGLKGHCLCPATACSAGLNAIGEAYSLIRDNVIDAALCGGAEACLTRTVVAGFSALRALSAQSRNPQRASRPFDGRRDGLVLSEGVGLLVLEELSSAERRGTAILAELVGYGASGDGYHVTTPDPNGDGAYRCMKMAIDESSRALSDFGYINAHGTSTPHNDYIETEAIKKVFGNHAYKLSISSTKSSTGHLLGAAGGVEAIFTILALYHGKLPPTINFERVDPSERPDYPFTCDRNLDYVPNVARSKKVEFALCNAFSFGGTNACIAVARWPH
ncbi:MAG: beta-ketoacyl-ACP synthase II [Gemmatimonadetes bacterium]|nr:beta-ketoacyl-ACP synthase II [Gemmatimonadota bacterium]MXY83213.1 beta-ketoacyl-ACP synthase II [Gemmatimonadota bacterium]MYB68694.1 beta-ketoacyl-ACP synthase II [Gemmatimonadota bacterium]